MEISGCKGNCNGKCKGEDESRGKGKPNPT